MSSVRCNNKNRFCICLVKYVYITKWKMRPIFMIMCDKTSFISTDDHQKTKEVEDFDFLAHGISFTKK